MNSVEWNPKHNLLAYAGDDKNKYQADEGVTASPLLSALSYHCTFFFFLRIAHASHLAFPFYFVAGVFRMYGFEGA